MNEVLINALAARIKAGHMTIEQVHYTVSRRASSKRLELIEEIGGEE